VNANSIVIPVNQNRDFTYIKLIYWYVYFQITTTKLFFF
jgi:hypothetical protein